jgi:hypothetical protein
MRFFRPIPEPQVTEPELLQENKNDIVGNKILHCGKLMDDIFQTLTCVFPCIDTHFAMILLCNWRLISKELEK